MNTLKSKNGRLFVAIGIMLYHVNGSANFFVYKFLLWKEKRGKTPLSV